MRWAQVRASLIGLGAGCLALSGCAEAPSLLDVQGPHAARILDLWWLMLTLATGVFVLVIGLLTVALVRRRPPPDGRPPTEEQGSRFARLAANGLMVGGGIVLPLVILVPLAILSFREVAVLARPPRPPAVTVEVTGRQYWWEVRYPDHGIITANEIHIPIGEPVRVVLKSGDVIHSFWVPRLMGKHDMTPGRVDETWMQADRPGTYWGQCTELCGIQHARMAFVVVASEPEHFAAWAENQRQPAVASTDPLVQRGAQVFARQGCIACHAVRYGDAPPVGGQAGVPGPDLTHLASRLTLGAGTLENNRGNLSGWVANPQALKPGNLMPTVPMDGDSLLALVAYLESLK
jgi:cytochrome c oxidase subunit II